MNKPDSFEDGTYLNETIKLLYIFIFSIISLLLSGVDRFRYSMVCVGVCALNSFQIVCPQSEK